MSNKKYFTEEERKTARKEYRRKAKKKIKEYNDIYYQKNKNKELKRAKKYRKENPLKVSKTLKNYRNKNKEKINKNFKCYYQKNRKKIIKQKVDYNTFKYKTDINFKIKSNLRAHLRTALKRNYKAGSAVRDLGCSIPKLKLYLESKFKLGMNWENYGLYGWHIDHIIPLVSFNLSNRVEFLKACHYTNLQPLWAEENLKKNKYQA